jgi:hypothetical protein
MHNVRIVDGATANIMRLFLLLEWVGSVTRKIAKIKHTLSDFNFDLVTRLVSGGSRVFISVTCTWSTFDVRFFRAFSAFSSALIFVTGGFSSLLTFRRIAEARVLPVLVGILLAFLTTSFTGRRWGTKKDFSTLYGTDEPGSSS